MCFELKTQQLRVRVSVSYLDTCKCKVRVSYLDVRNQGAKCHIKISGFQIKHTVFVMYQNIERSKEATSKVFRDLKARNKALMKHLKVKMTRA